MHDVDAVNVSRAELSLAELDDGELLALTRSGNQDAYAALFERYSYAALRLARHLGQKDESDDVVSESFAQVLDLLNRGKGPDRAFRAYLFTTVRHECGRRAKARQRVMPTDDDDQIDAPVEFGAGRLDMFERTAIRAAYESLPARWRTVLWHLDVEGRKPNELGPLLDLSPNSVSALVYRARSGLREAYVQQHVNEDEQAGSQVCLEHRAKLSAFVRRTASARDQEKIHAHLQTCKDCLAIYLDLQDVNREVGTISASAALAVSAASGLTGFAGLTLISGGLMSTVTNIAVLTKGVVAAVVPTVAAAAITTATLVGPPSVGVAEPSRTQIITATIPPVVQHEVPSGIDQPTQAAGRLAAGSAPSPGGPKDAASSIPSPAVAPAAKPVAPAAVPPAAAAPAPRPASRPASRPAPKLLPAAVAAPVEVLPPVTGLVQDALPVAKDLVKALPVDLGLTP
ncbi:MAG: sigma-70 family RNA polymerase sigma factor [Aeromicrobium sp.]